jgi:hypothetical protein
MHIHDKLPSFCQGSHPIMMYALEFKQLACDISWDEITFMNQFQFGLCNDMKDLLFTMLNLSMLNKTITQVVQFDNKLLECQQENIGNHHQLKGILHPLCQPNPWQLYQRNYLYKLIKHD